MTLVDGDCLVLFWENNKSDTPKIVKNKNSTRTTSSYFISHLIEGHGAIFVS